MRDDDTESHRLEQGRPPRPDPRERQAAVPIAFSTGGVLSSGADDARDPGGETGEGIPESADATRAVERGAAEIAAERARGRDRPPPSAGS